jgi:hypothetical protein
LTFISGTPVMTGDVSGGTAVYYTPYVGQFVPIWNGSAWVMTEMGGELSQSYLDASKSPAAGLPNSIYDMFVWSDSGTVRCTRGPVWTNQTTRAMSLARMNGVFTNASDILNGPKANLGTYVGTVMTGVSGYDFHQGGASAGGLAATLGLWNMYNRVEWAGMVSDTTSSWTYATASWRPANNSNSNRVNYVCGLPEDPLIAQYVVEVMPSQAAVTSLGYAGVGIDSVSVPTGLRTGVGSTAGSNSATFGPSIAASYLNPGPGMHFIQALENSPQAQSVTFYGQGGGTFSAELGVEFRL